MYPLSYLTEVFVFTSIWLLDKSTHNSKTGNLEGKSECERHCLKKKLFWFRFFSKINKYWQSVISYWLSVEVLNEFLMSAEETWWLYNYKISFSFIHWPLGSEYMKQWNLSSQPINLELFVLVLKYAIFCDWFMPQQLKDHLLGSVYTILNMFYHF